MSKLNFTVDSNELGKDLKEFKDNFEADLIRVVGSLADLTYAKALDLSQGLPTNHQQRYRDALTIEPIEQGVWIIELNKSALDLEDGKDPYSMYDTHLSGPKAKTSKDGHKYLTIPFKHNKKPSQQAPKAQQITEVLKKELKDRNIPYKQLELNSDGSPRIGKLHSFDVNSAKPSRNAKDPALKGVSIYQSKNKDGSVRRDIMTFRVISDRFRGDGRWQQPGQGAHKILDQALEWADREWESNLLPELMKKYENMK